MRVASADNGYLMKDTCYWINSINESRMRRLAGIYAFMVITMVSWLFYTTINSSNRHLLGLGVIVVLLGALPGFVYLWRGARSSILLLPLHGLYYSVMFGMPVFYAHINWFGMPGAAIEYSLMWVGLGLVSLYLMFLLSGATIVKNITLQWSMPAWDSKRAYLIGWLCIAANILEYFMRSLRHVSSLNQLLSLMGYIGIGIIFDLHLRDGISKLQIAAFYAIALPLQLILRLGTGSLANVMIIVLYMACIYWAERRRVPMMMVVFLIMLIFLVNPVKYVYRYSIGPGDYYANRNALRKAELFINITWQYMLGKIHISHAKSSTLNRFDDLSIFTVVNQETPIQVPYWHGATYASMLTGFIPRMLWTGKPLQDLGNIFGRRYDILESKDSITSLNFPWITEFYANYGGTGVIIGMALVGLALRLIYNLFAYEHPSLVIMQCTITVTLFFAESNLSLMWNGLIETIITSWLILYLCSVNNKIGDNSVNISFKKNASLNRSNYYR